MIFSRRNFANAGKLAMHHWHSANVKHSRNQLSDVLPVVERGRNVLIFNRLVVLSLLFGGVIPLSLTLTNWSGFKYLNWLLNGLIWNLDCVLIVPRGWNLMFLLTRHNCSIGSTVFLSVPQYLLKTPVQTKLTWRPFLSNDIVQYETALPPQKSNQWHLKNHYHFTTSCLISNWKANGGEQSVVRVGHISV